jgi:hypothetical protein
MRLYPFSCGNALPLCSVTKAKRFAFLIDLQGDSCKTNAPTVVAASRASKQRSVPGD